MLKSLFFYCLMIGMMLLKPTTVSAASSDTRLPSIPCSFEGTIINYQVDRDHERYILTIAPTLVSTEDWCAHFQQEFINGYWYSPTATLPSGALYKPDQPAVDVRQVLQPGSKIKGYADSLDSTIEQVQVLEAVTETPQGLKAYLSELLVAGCLPMIFRWALLLLSIVLLIKVRRKCLLVLILISLLALWLVLKPGYYFTNHSCAYRFFVIEPRADVARFCSAADSQLITPWQQLVNQLLLWDNIRLF